MGLHISFDKYTTDGEVLFTRDPYYEDERDGYPWDTCHIETLGTFYENGILEYWAEQTLGVFENNIPKPCSPAHLYKLRRRLLSAIDRGSYYDFPVFDYYTLDHSKRIAMISALLEFISGLLYGHDDKRETIYAITFYTGSASTELQKI